MRKSLIVALGILALAGCATMSYNLADVAQPYVDRYGPPIDMTTTTWPGDGGTGVTAMTTYFWKDRMVTFVRHGMMWSLYSESQSQ